ncbi:hypothetical protein [Gracilimonas mengyeensis]|uniref:Outer membrane protein beta-barrel family protein n=1 Tax=Gracilimonas mengyeensis TaxID=1302730 RepID=A0A521B5D2_9BACT|nr:hypothetical protein [Gracilimonas mengyeensis]SMO42289.1 hypothetical protein SAMN06265219_10231 [Gracilimonas mengyeensis]
MKKPALPFALLFLTVCSSPLFAQQSIGFSDSTDFQYILDYRLPDWGYSNFYLESGSFQSSGEYLRIDDELFDISQSGIVTTDTDHNTHSIRINLTPAYRYFRQSEDKTISLNTRLGVNTCLQGSSRQLEYEYDSNTEIRALGYDRDIYNGSYGSNYQVDLSIQNYLNENFFLLTAIDADFRYQWTDYSRKGSDDILPKRRRDLLERRLYLNPELGIGFGRLRNITPQIRAIRLNERYKSLGEASLTNREIIATAEHFTKLRGYQRTTDRYQKYFWGDMNQVLSGKLDAINAYNLLYLTDVLNETLGQRLEGFETSISGTFSYFNRLRREESKQLGETSIDRDTDINKALITTATIRWYKNLNLNHQISFVSENNLQFPLEDESDLKWTLSSQTSFNWLWTLTDRYLFTTRLQNQLLNPKRKLNTSNFDYLRNTTYLSGNLSYFIENRIALTGGASVGMEIYNRESVVTMKEKLFNWNVNASIRYYFARNLF